MPFIDLLNLKNQGTCSFIKNGHPDSYQTYKNNNNNFENTNFNLSSINYLEGDSYMKFIKHNTLHDQNNNLQDIEFRKREDLFKTITKYENIFSNINFTTNYTKEVDYAFKNILEDKTCENQQLNQITCKGKNLKHRKKL